MSSATRSLSVVIPAYNEEGNNVATLENVTGALSSLNLDAEILRRRVLAAPLGMWPMLLPEARQAYPPDIDRAEGGPRVPRLVLATRRPVGSIQPP
jgi:hypothetical protein